MTNLLGIPFDFMGLAYFSTEREDIKIGDAVVCETEHGTYVGTIRKIRAAKQEELENIDFPKNFPEIVRLADFRDKRFQSESEKKGELISKETQKQADTLKLGMKVLKTYLDINGSNAIITFTSDARVDFRELVKYLNSRFHLRFELRQIGPRDQAKLVGGIGSCGLPLCCATFLTSFDGISIAMAKNQLLAINIPKLSGQCGKLMCCLKFEDKAYAELRPQYPKIGEKFTYNDKSFEVNSLNLLTDTITAYDGSNYETFTKEEFERVKQGLPKSDKPDNLLAGDVNGGVDLSGMGIEETNARLDQIHKQDQKRKEEQARQQQQNKKHGQKPNGNPQQGKQNGNPQQHDKGPRPNNNQPQKGQNQKGQQPQQNKGQRPNNNGQRPQNQGNHSFGGNNHNHGNRSFNGGSNPYKKSSSGFIPVSQIADKSVLDVKPVNVKDEDKDDKK